MDFILEIFLRGLIANTLGIYSRYLFFLLIGRKKTIKYLSGKTKDERNNIGQNFLNAVVGLVVALMIALCVLSLFE